jgi:hypothetical protein
LRKNFYIPGFNAEVISEPDVCVIGGGAAGLSAAVGAARTGLSVLLIEKYGFCGGATVAGLSGTICGLFSSGNNPEQIVFGFADEFAAKLKEKNGAKEPVKFGRTKLIPHDSFVWKETADRFLSEENIKVLYHSNFIKAFTDDSGKVEALLIRGMEGEFVIKPGYVIDASGDAEVVHSINGKTNLGNNGIVQTPTMIFRLGNINISEFLKIDPEEINAAVRLADNSGEYKLPRHHVYIFPMPNGNEVLCNMTRITYADGRIPIGISSEDMTFAEMEGRKQAREYAEFLKNKFFAFSKSYIVETGTQVGIRQTRSIIGKIVLKNDDVINAKKIKDPVTFSAWPIEAHGAGALKIVYLEDDHYDIPFETLIPNISSNLLAAGRCISAEHEALASARVTAQCFGMGYAAGAACGLMKKEKISSQNLTGTDTADWMRTNKLKTAGEK